MFETVLVSSSEHPYTYSTCILNTPEGKEKTRLAYRQRLISQFGKIVPPETVKVATIPTSRLLKAA
jgi:hypothetical protein